jgi:phenylacetate-CoA ligase
MRPADQWYVAARLAVAMRSQWWSAPRIRAYQNLALVRMMRHAVSNVPFYQRLKLDAATIVSAADLARFPLIAKRDVQRSPESFLAAGVAPAELYSSRTSGSSGQPMTTYFDRRAWLLCKYVLKMRRIVATAGVPILKRVMIISGEAPALLEASAESAPSGLGVIFSQKRLSVHTPPEQNVAALARYRPHAIYAFPSYLMELVSTAERLGLALPKIKTLYTSSEVLTPAARRRIETAFGGRLYDVYGSTEFKEVASQCRSGRYHVNFESVYIEAQQAGAPAPLVLSTLCNFAMPLLRFDIGDHAAFGADSCPCGRASAHMLEFIGRDSDMITLPSGKRVSRCVLTNVLDYEESILQYRIVQSQADAFRIDAVVRTPGQSGLWRARVCAELARLVGEPVRFAVREVNELERAPSGKRSVFVRANADLK